MPTAARRWSAGAAAFVLTTANALADWRIVPVTWNDVENCLKKKRAELLRFRSDQALARVEKQGDLFEPVEELKQKLPKKWEL